MVGHDISYVHSVCYMAHNFVCVKLHIFKYVCVCVCVCVCV